VSQTAFTVATWNILATAYIRPEFYPRTAPEWLDPAWRVPALVARGVALDVDVLCLQEVEPNVFGALETALVGYAGSYSQKAKRPDGCATFARRGRFQQTGVARIPLPFGHVAHLLRLEHDGRHLTIVNTHLKWDPPGTARDHQWGYRQISRVAEALRAESPAPSAAIVCGDFNVLPDSDVVELLVTDGYDYAHRNTAGVRTCNSNGEAKLIDYLFYSESLRAEPRLPVPIDGQTPLPSPDQPSDHLPLVAQFDWR